MTEREFLERRAERIKARLGRRSDVVNREVETAIGPVVRDHPRKSLAAAGVVGVALGAALKPASSAVRGSTSGVFGFLKSTAAYALRAKLAGSIISDGDDESDGD
jgi:hypothetical protein